MNDLLLLSIEIGIDPVLVNEWGIEITWHGLFTALGVIIGVAVATAFARRAGYQEDTIYNVALCLVIGGIIGARALYVIENWSDFESDPVDIIRVNTGGISIYGALIGGTIGAFLYAFFAKVPNIPRGADIAAMGATLGMAVGRIGDVINGEHFADSTDLPWGLVYTHADSPSVIARVTQPQHPAVAYEMIGDVVIFGLLLLIFLRTNRPGLTFFAWVFMYGLLRTLVSFLRLDDIVFLGLRTAQVIGIGGIIIGLGGIVYLLRKPPEEGGRAERRRTLREEEAAIPAEGSPAPAEEPAT
jgi:phosphatidylglycerol:prolipoprotein diacylglycerol transferase